MQQQEMAEGITRGAAGPAAVLALVQWGDEKVRAAPLYKDHLRSVLWRLGNMLGDAMPQCPEVTAAAK